MRFAKAFVATFCLFCVSTARGQVVVPGADGSDGAFNPTSNVQVDLSLAPTATWNGANPNPNQGKGVYDPDKWAVVYRYSSVNIPSNVTVTFANHPSRAPVVWLVSGNVIIDGNVILDATPASGLVGGQPGPGGFRGGRGYAGASNMGSGGHGPGGVHAQANGSSGHASYGTVGLPIAGAIYGNAQILPIIGGSGGGQNSNGAGGDAGGGAILIASTGTVSLGANRGIYARSLYGGNYMGSGGAIRIIANVVTGPGVLRAHNSYYPSGDGRIRIEANDTTGLTEPGVPAISFASPGAVATLWPPASAPTITVTLLDGHPVPADPRSSLDFPNADVSITNPNPVIVQLQCTNVPSSASVTVRVVPKSGIGATVAATFVSGNLSNSVWQAQIQLADGFAAIQARAVLP